MAAQFKIGAIGQVHIGVKEIQRAVGFYRDILGLPLLFEVPEQKMAFFDCSGVRLYLSEDQSEEFPSKPLLYYRVEDMDQAYHQLSANGVDFLREPHIVHSTPEFELWMAGFHDPEGNFIHLMHEAPVSA
ncbi:MAG: glyoxalase/bleomycin resistance/dioxygenase family protein [Xanthomonadales bacterium]|nr:glyoxalase/bleomycin resistance/dioxygenase family protein [Xanthomonadales bacterium]